MVVRVVDLLLLFLPLRLLLVLFFSLFVVVESRPLLLSQKTAGKEKEKKACVCVCVCVGDSATVGTYLRVCVLCEGGGGRGVVSCGK